MISKVSRTGGVVAGVLAALLVMTSMALPTGAWADTSNTQTVSTSIVQIPGTSTSSGGGIGIAGPAIALNIPPVVVQQNVQVDVSGNPNNVQHATNNATINQGTGAAAGNASGTNGGMAMSGSAMSSTMAVVLQINVQLIAGDTPAGGVTQNAGNDTTIDQMTLSGSGNSSANGSGSTSSSGAASASNAAVVSQVNTQVYAGPLSLGSAGTATQNVANSASIGQNLTSASGTTSAAGSSHATSGAVMGNMSQMINQYQMQFAP
jgi:hypothetical protein